ncbi:MAG TPA: hypothetical protein VGN27_12745 [Gaiellaceae bacterium]|nr:hypothetical protein [Gaiellaceae bacterium]
MLPHRLRIVALAAGLVLVVLSLGGGALGATSAGANGDIVFVQGGSIVRLTSGGLTTVVTGTSPSWSPDGTKIAFVSGGSIFTCTASSCGTTTSAALHTGADPAWSPSGTKIAFDDGGNVHTMTTAGASDTIIAAGTDPTWSPDSTKLAYASGGSIVTCTISNCSGTALSVATGSKPAWSPDGLTIAYQAGTNVFVVPASGGTANLVAAGSAPAWSPDTDSIVLVNASGQIAVTQGSGSVWQTPGVRDSTTTDSEPEWQTVAPVAVSAPSIFGTAQTGAQLSSTNGTWSGASATGYSYQWLRCDSAGNNCSNIPSATASTYAVVSADVGDKLRVIVTASNPAGSTASSQSSATAVITLAGTVNPPSNTVAPDIDLPGTNTVPMVGDFVSAITGSWSGSFPMSFAYQWVKCPAADPLNGSCFSIPGATSSFFTIPPSLYGMRIRVVVTATNSAASVHQSSAASEIVSAIAPRLTDTPPILGSTIVDQVLSVDTGTWEGSTPLTYTYQWRRCDPVGSLASCVAIPNAVTSSYSPQVADIGLSLRVYITASNPAGTVTGITNHTFPVVDKQHFSPSVTQQPTIAGTMSIGRQLTATVGTFDGDAPITTSLAWQRCDATGASCHTIPGATKVVYYPTTADLGSTLRLAITAKNGYGTLVATSDASEPVSAAPPRHKGRRIVGTPRGDYLAGGGYDDVILGLGGNDTILGGAGDDHLDGGPGNDVITGGPGADVILGGPGSDTIYAADGERDIIDCGPGRDRAVVDSVDIVKNCEVVQIVSPSAGTGSTTTTP